MTRGSVAAGAVALLLLLGAAPTPARQHQSPAGSTAPGEGGADAEAAADLERKALALLAEAVEEAQGLRLAESRVRVYAAAAALLWPRDEAAAREMFARAAEGVRALSQGADPADPQAHERAQGLWQLRNEMLQSVADRDPRLALEFLRSTRQPSLSRQGRGEVRPPDQELALENDLAARVAARDPREAARMIEDGLSRGLTPNLLSALQQLSQKDAAAASRLTAAVIARLRPADLPGSYDVSNLAAQLLALTTPPEPAPSPAPGGPVRLQELRGRGARLATDRIEVDAASRRALVETLVTAVLSRPHDRTGSLHGVVNSLRSVLPEIERYAPARAAAVRRQVEELDRAQDPRGRLWSEYQHLFQQGGDGTALLEAAEKAPPEIRDDLYRNAAWRFHGEDFERALAVAARISDPQQRAQLLQEFERQRPWRAAERGDFAQARQLIAGLQSADQRAAALVALARSALGRGMGREAAGALAEARAQLGDRAQNGAQFTALLDVAGAYAAVDAAESFAIVESAVGQLNELIAAAAVVDGFTINSFREGELSPNGWQVWPEFIRRCAQALAALAPADFDRARAAARRFERPDARVIAELQLAQALLSRDLPLQRGAPLSGRAGGGIVMDLRPRGR